MYALTAETKKSFSTSKLSFEPPRSKSNVHIIGSSVSNSIHIGAIHMRIQTNTADDLFSFILFANACFMWCFSIKHTNRPFILHVPVERITHYKERYAEVAEEVSQGWNKTQTHIKCFFLCCQMFHIQSAITTKHNKPKNTNNTHTLLRFTLWCDDMVESGRRKRKCIQSDLNNKIERVLMNINWVVYV